MDTIAADLVADPAGEGPTPRLALDGFDGPLALLLTMARATRSIWRLTPVAARGDAEGLDTTALYLPPWRDQHTVANARERILRLLAETPAGAPLGSFLPSAAPPD